jgi:S-DNA-T family DNA segregation ATPase FtsK/SpoIIIE
VKYKNQILSKYNRFHNYICGAAWCVLGLIIFTSVVTYYKYDASFNIVTTDLVIRNYLGEFGSYLADLLIQFIGKENSISTSILFFIFGINLFVNHAIYNGKKKFFSFVGFIFSSNILFESGFLKLFLLDLFDYLPQFILELFAYLILFISITILTDFRNKKYIIWSAKFSRIVRKVYAFCFSLNFREKIRRKFFTRKDKFIVIDIPKAQNTEQQQTQNVEIVKSKTDVYDDKNSVNIKEKSKITKARIQKEEIKSYLLPIVTLLKEPEKSKYSLTNEELIERSKLLKNNLKDFKIDGEITNISQGPIVTLYEFVAKAGTRESKVIALANDIARSMEVVSTRIATLTGKNAFGVELPNPKREIIYIKTLLSSSEYQKSKHALPIILGTDISGMAVVADLAKMPHLLVAGTTGSGKSVAINTMIISLLYKFHPDQCKFIMIDPKMLELSIYDGIPHLLIPVVTEPTGAISALKWACREMEDRYKIMSLLNVRNIDGYNEKLHEAIKENRPLLKRTQIGFDDKGQPLYYDEEIEKRDMPYIVVIVDEMADLMITAGKEIEASIQRLAQKARAAGIHVIMATQRPSVDVITGVIKSNFPTRISFQVVSSFDSKTILGYSGAEQLLGKGDMLYMANGGKIMRAHGPFVDDGEVEKIVEYIKRQGIRPKYIEEVLKEEEIDEIPIIKNNNIESDIFNGSGSSGDGRNKSLYEKDDQGESLYEKALDIIISTNSFSTSLIQRTLRIGYNKAALLVDELTKNGILSEPDAQGKRKILKDNL